MSVSLCPCLFLSLSIYLTLSISIYVYHTHTLSLFFLFICMFDDCEQGENKPSYPDWFNFAAKIKVSLSFDSRQTNFTLMFFYSYIRTEMFQIFFFYSKKIKTDYFSSFLLFYLSFPEESGKEKQTEWKKDADIPGN